MENAYQKLRALELTNPKLTVVKGLKILGEKTYDGHPKAVFTAIKIYEKGNDFLKEGLKVRLQENNGHGKIFSVGFSTEENALAHLHRSSVMLLPELKYNHKALQTHNENAKAFDVNFLLNEEQLFVVVPSILTSFSHYYHSNKAGRAASGI